MTASGRAATTTTAGANEETAEPGPAPSDSHDTTPPAKRVVYLLGAGATQGSVTHRGSTTQLLMQGDLKQDLLDGTRKLALDRYEDEETVMRLVNTVVGDDTDFEHILTFLEDAPSEIFASFARDLKTMFAEVLRERLELVESELHGGESALYGTLIDMHGVPELNEALHGFLTLNYDLFLERAIINGMGRSVDYGISVSPTTPTSSETTPIKVIKLHGSFGWSNDWPVSTTGDHSSAFWIPPGIRKSKEQYPFNALWGLARELLECDVLRIVGCNLGANDWDLVSLIFTTMHTHVSATPFEVEIISSPTTANRIRRQFPYLQVRSILDIEDIGPAIVSENLGGEPRSADSLTDEEMKLLLYNVKTKARNAFEYWLIHKAAAMFANDFTIDTDRGLFSTFVESHVA